MEIVAKNEERSFYLHRLKKKLKFAEDVVVVCINRMCMRRSLLKSTSSYYY